jgi:hypothetical protein
MFFWFAGLSVLLVWQVFHDPRIDYRLVVLGALLPDVVDGLFGGARVLHSLSFSVVLLAVVMLVRRRPLRRRLLAVPIGTFLHLVLDGMWARTDVFWWPFTGWSFGDPPLPSFDRSPVLVVAMEVAGLVALWWFAGVRGAEDRVP